MLLPACCADLSLLVQVPLPSLGDTLRAALDDLQQRGVRDNSASTGHGAPVAGKNA